MTASPTPKFRVAICGGGIGGISLGIALARYPDIAIDIYEAAPKFEELGSGITIWGTGRTVLRRMGLDAKLAPIAGVLPHEPNAERETVVALRRGDQPTNNELGLFRVSSSLGFHRGRLLAVLLDFLEDTGRAKIHFGKRCVSFTQWEEDDANELGPENFVTLQFADGTSAACDVLVGADGIKSSVRGQLLRTSSRIQMGDDECEQKGGRYVGTKFSGTVVYRAFLKTDDVRGVAGEHRVLTRTTMYCGHERHVVAYPMGGGLVHLVGYCSDSDKQEEWKQASWETQSRPGELFEMFQGWESEVQALMQCVDKTSRWAIYEVEPLPFWSKGRVTLLGDAAHAMPPFLGCGGGLTIEDAYVLGYLLGSPLANRENLPSVLRAYETVRRPRVSDSLLSTREAGQIQDFRGAYENLTNENVEEKLNKTAEWLWEGKRDPDDDLRVAEGMLRETVPEETNIRPDSTRFPMS